MIYKFPHKMIKYMQQREFQSLHKCTEPKLLLSIQMVFSNSKGNLDQNRKNLKENVFIGQKKELLLCFITYIPPNKRQLK